MTEERSFRRALEPVKALNFAVGADKASTYRAIMATFAEAHQRYAVTLATTEIASLLAASPWSYDLGEQDRELDNALGYLEREPTSGTTWKRRRSRSRPRTPSTPSPCELSSGSSAQKQVRHRGRAG